MHHRYCVTWKNYWIWFVQTICLIIIFLPSSGKHFCRWLSNAANFTAKKVQSLIAYYLLITITIYLYFLDARLETVLMRLKLLNTELKLLSGLSDSLSNISSVLQNLQTNSTNNNTVTLSYTERLRKHSNYVSKLKICIKMYLNLNERLSKEIKFAKWYGNI